MAGTVRAVHGKSPGPERHAVEMVSIDYMGPPSDMSKIKRFAVLYMCDAHRCLIGPVGARCVVGAMWRLSPGREERRKKKERGKTRKKRKEKKSWKNRCPLPAHGHRSGCQIKKFLRTTLDMWVEEPRLQKNWQSAGRTVSGNTRRARFFFSGVDT